MLEALLDAAKSLVHIVTPLNLFVISFIEAIFFPIPPDVVLIPLVLLRPEGGLFYALLAAVASVMGATVGYFIGSKGGKPILRRFASNERIVQTQQLLERYDAWAIAIAAFTPIPYKVFAIAAGVFSLDLRRFLIVSIVSRASRFGLIAVTLMIYGAQVAEFIQRHFEWLTVGVTLFVVLGVWGYHILSSRADRT